MSKSTCNTFEQFVTGLAHFPEALVRYSKDRNLYELYNSLNHETLEVTPSVMYPSTVFTNLGAGEWEANTLVSGWDEVPEEPFIVTSNDSRREFFIRRSASRGTWSVKLINGWSVRVSSKDMEAMAQLCAQYMNEHVNATG